MSSSRKRKRVTVPFNFPSLSKQSFKSECDVNSIMSRYCSTGVVDHLNHMADRGKTYGDFSIPLDYHQACNLVQETTEMFSSLPSSIRSRFENDPSKFLDFAQDSKNSEEMKKMGLSAPYSKEDHFSSESGNDSGKFSNNHVEGGAKSGINLKSNSEAITAKEKSAQ